MPAYRFYSLPRVPSATPTERVFYNDGVALLWGFRSAGKSGMEVWDGSRFVGRIHGGEVIVQAEVLPATAESF